MLLISKSSDATVLEKSRQKKKPSEARTELLLCIMVGGYSNWKKAARIYIVG